MARYPRDKTMKTRKTDGARRHYQDTAKRLWYARQRTVRYARYIHNLTTA